MNFKSITVCICLLLAQYFSYARVLLTDTIPAKNNLCKIQLFSGLAVKGFIVGATDSTIEVLSKKNWRRLQFSEHDIIHARNIVSITKNFKNGLTAGKGALIGASTGILLGIALAFKGNGNCDGSSDPNCDDGSPGLEEGFKRSAIFGSILGAGGALIGLFSRKKTGVLSGEWRSGSDKEE